MQAFSGKSTFPRGEGYFWSLRPLLDKSEFTSLLLAKNLRPPILGEAEVFSYAIVWVFYQNSPLLSLRALAWVSSRRLNSSL